MMPPPLLQSNGDRRRAAHEIRGARRCVVCDATLLACNLAQATGAGKCCPDCKHPEPWATCQQVGCKELASSRFYWPGDAWQAACPAHARRAFAVANAMGFALEIEPLPALVE